MPTKFNYDLIQGVSGNTNVTPEFISAVEALAERLGTKPEFLLAAMSFETGGKFSASIQNGIGATGLIQFLKSTAIGLGTTTDKLKNMTNVEQLEFVEKYFKPFIGKVPTLVAVYTAIISGSPKKADDVLFKAGTPAYKLNPLDWNNDGKITAAEATTIVGARLFGGVKAVQSRLLDLDLVPDHKKGGFDDGRWGKNTSEALAAFQKSKGIKETGLMDEETGRALFSIKDEDVPEVTAATIVAGVEPANLVKGNEGDSVKTLQTCFVGLGYMSMEKIGGGFGKFGPMTESAVKAFQKHLGFEETGSFGTVEKAATDSIQKGIGKGNPNTQIVKAIQTQLVKTGFMTQAQIDTGFGLFGNQTETAVKNFQGENHVPQSGVVESVAFKLLFNSEEAVKPGETGTTMGQSGTHYTVLADVLITDVVQKKIQRVADIYFEKTGKEITVTSGFRPPERQAPAMYNKIVREGEASVRKLYKNKVAVDQILNAYRSNKSNKDVAIAAMIAVIDKQVKSGVFISSHLKSNAIDVRKTANLTALNSAVITVGGRIVLELDHYHLELH